MTAKASTSYVLNKKALQHYLIERDLKAVAVDLTKLQ